MCKNEISLRKWSGGTASAHFRISKGTLVAAFDIWLALTVEIDRYGFFGANTDTSAIHGPIADNWYFQIFQILFSASLSKI